MTLRCRTCKVVTSAGDGICATCKVQTDTSHTFCNFCVGFSGLRKNNANANQNPPNVNNKTKAKAALTRSIDVSTTSFPSLAAMQQAWAQAAVKAKKHETTKGEKCKMNKSLTTSKNKEHMDPESKSLDKVEKTHAEPVTNHRAVEEAVYFKDMTACILDQPVECATKLLEPLKLTQTNNDTTMVPPSKEIHETAAAIKEQDNKNTTSSMPIDEEHEDNKRAKRFSKFEKFKQAVLAFVQEDDFFVHTSDRNAMTDPSSKALDEAVAKSPNEIAMKLKDGAKMIYCEHKDFLEIVPLLQTDGSLASASDHNAMTDPSSKALDDAVAKSTNEIAMKVKDGAKMIHCKHKDFLEILPLLQTDGSSASASDHKAMNHTSSKPSDEADAKSPNEIAMKVKDGAKMIHCKYKDFLETLPLLQADGSSASALDYNAMNHTSSKPPDQPDTNSLNEIPMKLIDDAEQMVLLKLHDDGSSASTSDYNAMFDPSSKALDEAVAKSPNEIVMKVKDGAKMIYCTYKVFLETLLFFQDDDYSAIASAHNTKPDLSLLSSDQPDLKPLTKIAMRLKGGAEQMKSYCESKDLQETPLLLLDDGFLTRAPDHSALTHPSAKPSDQADANSRNEIAMKPKVDIEKMKTHREKKENSLTRKTVAEPKYVTAQAEDIVETTKFGNNITYKFPINSKEAKTLLKPICEHLQEIIRSLEEEDGDKSSVREQKRHSTSEEIYSLHGNLNEATKKGQINANGAPAISAMKTEEEEKKDVILTTMKNVIFSCMQNEPTTEAELLFKPVEGTTFRFEPVSREVKITVEGMKPMNAYATSTTATNDRKEQQDLRNALKEDHARECNTRIENEQKASVASPKALSKEHKSPNSSKTGVVAEECNASIPIVRVEALSAEAEIRKIDNITPQTGAIRKREIQTKTVEAKPKCSTKTDNFICNAHRGCKVRNAQDGNFDQAFERLCETVDLPLNTKRTPRILQNGTSTKKLKVQRFPVECAILDCSSNCFVSDYLLHLRLGHIFETVECIEAPVSLNLALNPFKFIPKKKNCHHLLKLHGKCVLTGDRSKDVVPVMIMCTRFTTRKAGKCKISKKYLSDLEFVMIWTESVVPDNYGIGVTLAVLGKTNKDALFGYKVKSGFVNSVQQNLSISDIYARGHRLLLTWKEVVKLTDRGAQPLKIQIQIL